MWWNRWRTGIRSNFALGIALAGGVAAADLALPLEPKSVRVAVIGDTGTGASRQYETAQEMLKWHDRYPFDAVLMLGDNMYGGEGPSDFRRKFEEPYKPLLDAGVKFYASLGNHDNPNECFYKPFHMDGKRYYMFHSGDADFFALDSNQMDAKQLEWLTKHLQNSKAAWKICFFHHPLYSDGKFHGPDRALRGVLEPVFDRYGVKIVLSGHEHIYERLKPRLGVNYFVVGNSGELRRNNLRRSADTAKGYDADRTFLLMEITKDRCYFQTVARSGATVDSGMIPSE